MHLLCGCMAPPDLGSLLSFPDPSRFESRVKSLIVTPLQPLIKAGFFNGPTSRRLVIIDCLNEYPEPKVHRNILEVLANAKRQHRLPLIFLFASSLNNTSPLHLALGYCLG